MDAVLQREGAWYRAEEEQARLGSSLRFYGASVGAVRGAIRDLGLRHPNPTHDQITALASELWADGVFERRLATIVLLQTHLSMLANSDLTRIEGFIRTAQLRALVDPMATDVVGPLIDHLDSNARARADVVLDRWSGDDDPWLQRAALLSPVRALRAGGGDWPAFLRRQRRAVAASGDDCTALAREAIEAVTDVVARFRPELPIPAVGA